MTAYVNNKKSDIQQGVLRQVLEQQVLALVEPIPARLSWLMSAEKQMLNPKLLSISTRCSFRCSC